MELSQVVELAIVYQYEYLYNLQYDRRVIGWKVRRI